MRLSKPALLWLCAAALLVQLSQASELNDDFMVSASAPAPITGLGRILAQTNSTPPPPLFRPPPTIGSPIVTFVAFIRGAGTAATFDQAAYLNTVSQEVIAQGGVGAIVSIESITDVYASSLASTGRTLTQGPVVIGVRVQTRITYPIGQTQQAAEFANTLATPTGQEFLKNEYGAQNVTVVNVINNPQPPAPPPRPRPRPPPSRLPPRPPPKKAPPPPKKKSPPPPKKKSSPPPKKKSPPPSLKHRPPPSKKAPSPPPKKSSPPPKKSSPPPRPNDSGLRAPPPKKGRPSPSPKRLPPPKKGRSPPPAEAAALGGIWYVPFTGGWYRWNAARPGNTYTLYKDGSGNFLSVFLGYGGLLGKYPFGRGIFFNRGGAAQVSAQLNKVNKNWVLSVTAGGRRMPANTQWTLGRNVTVQHIKFPGKLWVVVTTPEVRITAKHRVPKKPGQIADPRYGEWLDVYVTILSQPKPPVQGFLGTTWRPRAIDVASAASLPTAAFEFGERDG